MFARTSVRRFALLSAFLVASACWISSSSFAQDASAPMRVARLTSSQGTVTVTDGNNPSAPAQMNLPLPAGVQIATGEDGQAEIEFEDGSVARLTPNSTLSLDRLDIAPGQVFVTNLSLLRGLAYFELRATPEYVYSVNAGGDVVSPVENATVRIDFDEAPASFAVLDGTAEVQRANSFQADLQAGETLRADPSNASRYFLTQQIASDTWDQWNADMDQQAAQQSSNSTNVRDNFAGPQGYGWGDLDADGTWYNVPGQGQVWQPYEADGNADFDPYGNGAWVSYPGMGYIWASGYPWGWTPYYCGAWSYYDSFGWGWAPGATCGGFGWGFGGGFAVNIAIGPRGYRPVRVPIARPGPVRPVLPVLPVRTTSGTWRPPQHNGPPMQHGPRQIAGVTAQPIAPAHTGFVAGSANEGASLHRDFPIDRTTHTPAMGQSSARGANIYHVGPQNTGQPAQAQQPQQGFDRRGGTNNTAPAVQGQLPPVIYGSGNSGGSGAASRSGQNGGQQQSVQPQQPLQQQQPLQGGFQGQGQRTRGLQPGSAPQQQSAPQNQPTYARPQHTTPQQMDSPQQNAQPQPQRYTPQPNSQQQQQRQFSPPSQPQHTEPAHPNYTPSPSQPHQNYSPAPSSPLPAPSSPPPAPHESSPPPSAPAPSHR